MNDAIVLKVKKQLEDLEQKDMLVAMDVVLAHPISTAVTFISVGAEGTVNVNREIYFKTALSALSILLASGFIQLKSLSD